MDPVFVIAIVFLTVMLIIIIVAEVLLWIGLAAVGGIMCFILGQRLTIEQVNRSWKTAHMMLWDNIFEKLLSLTAR